MHDAVEKVLSLTRAARQDDSRKLVLLTGVPGAGKTLVGLQVAHRAALDENWQFGTRRRRGAPATFLSGNGPLVQVLQDALKSRAFAQDMHRYIREHGLEQPERVPSEKVPVFDEVRRQRLVRDPHRLRTNAYRVLLTRGREGMVLFVPPEPTARMDATVQALITAGAVFVRVARQVLAA